MYGRFFNYAKSKYDAIPSFESASSAIKKTVTQAAAVGKAIYNSIDSEAFIQRWEGFSRMLDPANITFYLRKPKVRKVMNQAMLANLVFMLPVLSYEMFKYYFYENIYDPEHQTDNTFSAYSAYLAAWVVNTGVDIYFSPAWAKMTIDDTVYNADINTVVSDENPDAEHKKTCGCEDADILFASLISGMNFGVDMAALWAADWIADKTAFYLLKIIIYFLRVRINGRALTEVNLSKMCTKHRNEFLAKNNGFSDGIGLAYQMAVDGVYVGLHPKKSSLMYSPLSYLQEVMELTLGPKHKFIYDPLSYMVFQIFIMISLLTNKPLPGKKEQKDTLYYIHMGMASILNQISKSILSYLNTDSGGCDFVVAPVTFKDFTPEVILEDQKVSEESIAKDVADYLLDNMNKIDGTCDTAYIYTKDQYLFYLNKKEKTCTFINISNEAHGDLKNKLLVNLSLEVKDKSRCVISKLSVEQLQLITKITDHMRQLDWKKLVKAVAEFPPVEAVNHYLIGDEYRSVETAIKVPAIKFLLDLNAAGLRTTLKKIEEIRGAWLPYLVKSILNQYTPASLEYTRSILELVFNDKSKDVFEQIKNILDVYDKYQNEIKEKIHREIESTRTVKKAEREELSKVGLQVEKAEKEQKKQAEQEKLKTMPKQSSAFSDEEMEEQLRKAITDMINPMNVELSEKPEPKIMSIGTNVVILEDDYNPNKKVEEMMELNEFEVISPEMSDKASQGLHNNGVFGSPSARRRKNNLPSTMTGENSSLIQGQTDGQRPVLQ